MAPPLRHALLRSLRSSHASRRHFHPSRPLDVVKPFLLADIGEGITECQLIQWFVQPGARVGHFDKICEVQSDKASVEITSPFDGVIKKLHYEPDDMAVTGKPLVDIDIEGEGGEEEARDVGGEGKDEGVTKGEARAESGAGVGGEVEKGKQRQSQSKDDFSTLATPAVRHLTKEMDVNISDVTGSGRDGRVLKEDVHRFASQRAQQQQPPPTPQPQHAPPAQHSPPPPSAPDRTLPLTPVQTQMSKLMTRSLTIPHFLYTTTADLTALTALRQTLNTTSSEKLTHLPFIIKALSLALHHHPLLNASFDPAAQNLTHHSSHNIGIAIDTPSGLLVPVLPSVQNLSILQIASALSTLSAKARSSALSPADFKDATFTVSNIGSVGGGVVSPIISPPQVGILAVGRSKVVPAFVQDGEGKEVLGRREELVLSWSADHRVVDGAECARCAERVRGFLEMPGRMGVEMR